MSFLCRWCVSSTWLLVACLWFLHVMVHPHLFMLKSTCPIKKLSWGTLLFKCHQIPLLPYIPDIWSIGNGPLCPVDSKSAAETPLGKEIQPWTFTFKFVKCVSNTSPLISSKSREQILKSSKWWFLYLTILR